MTKSEKLDKDFEIAIGKLYKAMYNMRENKLYQQEYDSIGVLINMLNEDRQLLREKYKVEF